MKQTLRSLSLTLVMAVVLAAVALPQSVGAATGPLCYVDAAAGGYEDGSTWTDAFTTLQPALVEPACLEIWVAAGVYKPGTSQTQSFVVGPGVAVYGGFAGGEEALAQRDWVANVTILSGDIDNNDLDPDGNHIDEAYGDIVGANSYTVVKFIGTGTIPVNSSTILDGFTITGGRGSLVGGGMSCLGSGIGHVCSPTLSNLTFSGNDAPGGGALYNDGSSGGLSSPALANVIFSGNHATDNGGAIENNGDGGLSSPSLSNVTFSGNTSGGLAGAMLNYAGTNGVSSPVIIDVTFDTNSAYQYGGALENRADSGGNSSPSLTNVTFLGNTVTHSGGGGGGGIVNYASSTGIVSPVLTNVTFNGNTSAQYGGAISNSCSSTSTCIPILTNVILWGDSATFGGNEVYDVHAAPSISYSVVQGGCAAISGATCGSGNLSTDPLFGAFGNYGGLTKTLPLLWGSSAVDTGTNASCPATDQRWRPRPADGDLNGVPVCDIGAYELPVFWDLPVAGKEWMEAWINAFFEAGITTGCGISPLRYCPENNVTRAEMAIFLLRAKHGMPYTPPPATHVFTDVPVTGKEWMEPWIDEFYAEGLTTGCAVDPPRFCPEQNVTRAEMAVFVERALHAPGWTPPAATGLFSDVPVAGKEWMQPWIEAFYNAGITTGCGVSPLRFCPENQTTRAEMAVFIDRAYGLYP